METGKADATPTARRCWRAAISNAASARSISSGVGTELIATSALVKGQVIGARQASCDAPRVGAVVDKYQAALFDLLQHRGEGLFGGGESRAHHADEPHIALEPGHQPVQPINVLLRGKRREQRLWARIVVGIIKRLHRHLEQDFVARGARTSSQPGIVAVGHESEGHGAGQLGDRLGGVFGADPKAFDDEGHPDSVRFARDGRHGLGEGVCRPHAVRGDFRQRPKRRHFEEFRIDFGAQRRRRTAARGWNHHFLVGASRTVDDIDRGRSGRDRLLALGRGGRASVRTIIPAGLAGCERLDDSHGLVFLAARGLCWRSGLRLDRNDRHWLAAERVVAHDRPDDKNREEKRQHPGNDLGDGEADGARRFLRCWPSGALKSSVAIALPRGSLTRESRNRVYHDGPTASP